MTLPRRWPAAPLPVLVLALGFLFGVSSAAAQTDARLVAAVRAAQDGRSDSARSTVERMLAATPPTDTLYPQILYTQAMVANTATDMRRHLQRVVVEYPTSSWADDALLRLVQMDYATRSFESAARNLERLRLDFASTPLFAQAAYWAGRTYFDLNDAAKACRWLADGVARSNDNIELQQQLRFLNRRCGAAMAGGDSGRAGGQTGSRADGQVDSSSADSSASMSKPAPTAALDSAAAPPTDSLPAGPSARPPAFRIQIAAVATPGAADDAAGKAEEAGFSAVIVRERGYYKVRAGEFSTRQDAQAAVAKLKAAVGGSPFVVAEP